MTSLPFLRDLECLRLAHKLSSRKDPEELKKAGLAACLLLRKGMGKDLAAWRGFQENPVKAHTLRRASESKT